MDYIKRLFGMGGDSPDDFPALTPFEISFPNGQTRPAVRVTRSTHPQSIIQALSLSTPMPAIFISGGAAMMDSESVNALRSLIEDGLVRFLSGRQISLIDGGTASGVMQLIGIARQRRNCTFPLIGVAPEKLVGFPGQAHPQQIADLDAYHSHFVLTSGDQFGAESETIIDLAYALSGAGAQKRLVIVLNGGEVVKKEAYRVSTHDPRFPLLVLEGSGRFADELAASRKMGSSDPLIRDILDQGMVHFLSVKAGADNLYRWLENFFGY